MLGLGLVFDHAGMFRASQYQLELQLELQLLSASPKGILFPRFFMLMRASCTGLEFEELWRWYQVNTTMRPPQCCTPTSTNRSTRTRCRSMYR